VSASGDGRPRSSCIRSRRRGVSPLLFRSRVTVFSWVRRFRVEPRAARADAKHRRPVRCAGLPKRRLTPVWVAVPSLPSRLSLGWLTPSPHGLVRSPHRSGKGVSSLFHSRPFRNLVLGRDTCPAVGGLSSFDTGTVLPPPYLSTEGADIQVTTRWLHRTMCIFIHC